MQKWFLLIFTNGKPKLANKMAIGNSVIVSFFFCLFRLAITDGEVFATSFAPAILYYFVSKAILSKKSAANNTNVNGDTQTVNKNENVNQAETDNNKTNTQ